MAERQITSKLFHHDILTLHNIDIIELKEDLFKF